MHFSGFNTMVLLIFFSVGENQPFPPFQVYFLEDANVNALPERLILSKKKQSKTSHSVISPLQIGRCENYSSRPMVSQAKRQYETRRKVRRFQLITIYAGLFLMSIVEIFFIFNY